MSYRDRLCVIGAVERGEPTADRSVRPYAQAHAARVIRARFMCALDRGESFVVARQRVPVGELTPIRRPPRAGEEAIAAFGGVAD